MFRKIVIMIAVALLWSGPALAAHPLITDDAGTQGKGKFQVEVNSEFGFDSEKEDGVTTKERTSEIATIISAGIADNIDIVLGLPYHWIRTREDGIVASDEDGIADISLETKWRFFEKGPFSLALKPGVTLPVGDEGKGLGTSRVTGSLFFIATGEMEPWAFHVNLGYVRNENEADEQKDLWHASLAAEIEVARNLKAVANVGIERNSDEESDGHPAFILGGLIYSVTDNFDVDFGVKAGLNKAETDYALLAGLTYGFVGEKR
jgi:hypothetical protein